jgi:hypothetical protein
MAYFFRGIADPDAIGKSVVSDNYSLVIWRSNGSSHLEARRGTRKLIEGFDGHWNVLAKFSPLIYNFVPKLNNNKFRPLESGGSQSG